MTVRLLDSHQPTLLLKVVGNSVLSEKVPTRFREFHTVIVATYLFFGVLVRDDVHDFPHFKVQLVDVLGLVLVGRLHLVQHSRRQVVGRRP